MVSESNTLNLIDQKEDFSEDVASKIINNPQLLPEILDGIFLKKARIRFRCAKILRIISEKKSEILYPKMDFFIKLFDSENKIIMWNTMDVIANMTSIDSKNKFNEIFEEYYNLLSDESMVTAAHVIDNSGKIAKAKPELQGRITAKLLRLEEIPRDEDCKNIHLGKAILAFDKYFDQSKNKDEIISFVKRNQNNPRNATKLKAAKFLKKHSNF